MTRAVRNSPRTAATAWYIASAICVLAAAQWAVTVYLLLRPAVHAGMTADDMAVTAWLGFLVAAFAITLIGLLRHKSWSRAALTTLLILHFGSSLMVFYGGLDRTLSVILTIVGVLAALKCRPDN